MPLSDLGGLLERFEASQEVAAFVRENRSGAGQFRRQYSGRHIPYPCPPDIGRVGFGVQAIGELIAPGRQTELLCQAELRRSGDEWTSCCW